MGEPATSLPSASFTRSTLAMPRSASSALSVGPGPCRSATHGSPPGATSQPAAPGYGRDHSREARRGAAFRHRAERGLHAASMPRAQQRARRRNPWSPFVPGPRRELPAGTFPDEQGSRLCSEDGANGACRQAPPSWRADLLGGEDTDHIGTPAGSSRHARPGNSREMVVGPRAMLPTWLPCASHPERFSADPFEFLAHNREVHGNVFTIPLSGPRSFPELSDRRAVVAVFGSELVIGRFSGTSSRLECPNPQRGRWRCRPNLVNLNRGLHSMPPDRHAVHKPLLMRTLGTACVEPHHESVWAGLEEHTERWALGSPTGLLALMREVVLRASAPVLFGGGHRECTRLAGLLQTYFHLRREASAPVSEERKPSRSELVAVGTSLDAELRTLAARTVPEPRLVGRSARQARQARPGAGSLDDRGRGRRSRQRAVRIRRQSRSPSLSPGSCSSFPSCPSSATSSGWRSALVPGRASRGQGSSAGRVSSTGSLPSVSGFFRLNASMVRITTRPTSLDGVELPGRCEVVVCPFLAHARPRDVPASGRVLAGAMGRALALALQLPSRSGQAGTPAWGGCSGRTSSRRRSSSSSPATTSS